MAIANKFIHFNTEAGFENYLFTGNGSGGGFLNQEGTNFETNTYSVKPEKQEEWNKFKNYTCFIKDTQKIWTHEKFYICSGGGESEIYVIPAEFFTTEDPSTRIKIYNELRSALENSKIIYLESDGTTSIPIIVYSSDDTITIEMVTNQPAENSEIMMLVSVKQTFKSDGTAPTMESLHTITTGKATPKANGTASAGSSANAAREDHVHPLQTSVSGNAGTATKLATAQTISLTGDVTGSASFDGSQAVSINAAVTDNSHNHDNSTITSIDASKITSGTIDIERLPKGALERLVIAENQAARFQLTSDDVQEGDTVKQEDTGVMYFVVDVNNLNNENGYKVYTAGAATSVPWSGVTNKPTKLSEFTNDSGFITNSALTEYATKEWVLQQLANYVSKTGDSTITGTLTATAFKES